MTTNLTSTHRNFGSKLTGALVLLVWVLGVPGIRPIVHHHQSEKPSASELDQLALHVRTYPHEETQDTARLHLHWLVLIDGHSIFPFPNSPIPQENLSSKSLSQSSDPLELSNPDLDGSDFLESVVSSDQVISNRHQGPIFPNRCNRLQTAEYARLTSFATIRYCAAYL
jgi:hypothetical protein